MSISKNFCVEFSVRYSDVDERSVVNNARYLNYFEEARMGLLDDLEANFHANFRGKVIVAHAECDYISSLVLRDQVKVTANIGRIGQKSFDVRYAVYNQNSNLVAKGSTTQVHYDYQSKSTIALTDIQKRALGEYLEV